jgi:hypothetical protein
VLDTVIGSGEVQHLYGDIRVGFNESCYSMEVMNESCGCRCNGLEGKLVQETDVWRRRLKRRVNTVSEDDTFQNS